MKRNALALSMLGLYQEGFSVHDICALTGMTQVKVVTRLCAASRHLAGQNSVLLDPEYALGVQWEFICWRA